MLPNEKDWKDPHKADFTETIQIETAKFMDIAKSVKRVFFNHALDRRNIADSIKELMVLHDVKLGRERELISLGYVIGREIANNENPTKALFDLLFKG